MSAVIFWLSVLLILYTYAGYPIILAALAKLFPRRTQQTPLAKNVPEHTPSITLLIAAYNEEAFIRARLENALQLDYPQPCLQILVAADGSNDRTVEIASKFAPRVEVSYSPERRGKIAAINHAMDRAVGEIIVLSDANNHYRPDCLLHLVEPFRDPQVGMVSGSKTILKGDGHLGDSEGLYWKYESFIKKQETLFSSTTGVAGEVLAFRRSLYQPAPDGIINDDFYLALKTLNSGFDIVYAPKAVSSERVSATATDEMARRARIIAGRYQAMGLAGRLLPWKRPGVVWQIVSHKFLRPLVPVAMIGAFIANLAAVLWPSSHSSIDIITLAPPFGLIFLLLQVAFYAAAWIGSQLNVPGLAGKLLYIPTFLVNSNLATLTGLYRFITRRQSTSWQRVNRREES